MGQQNQQMRRARLVASVAATIISLACGTNVSVASTYLWNSPNLDETTACSLLL